MQKWLTAVGPYRVEHMPMRHPSGSVDLSVPTGVLHTTEGSLESALSVFRSRMATPHFTVGRDRNRRVRVIQHVPLGEPAATLVNLSGGVETNYKAAVQIEIVEFSKTQPWLPDQLVTDALAEVMVAARRIVGIPLTRPFPDNPGAQPWATVRYSHRRAGKWGRIAGWYGHMDCPENCVTPETPILCADLVWRAAGDLAAGDKIVAFTDVSRSDSSEVRRHGRRFVTAEIVHNFEGVTKSCYEIAAGGSVVTASADHPWLVRRYDTDRLAWVWVRSEDLREGDLLAELVQPWKVDRSWDAGWLAGVLDADGSLHRNVREVKGVFWQMLVGQRESATLDRIVDAFRSRDMAVTVYERPPSETGFGGKRQPFFDVKLLGGRAAVMRLMGEIRPPRFWERDDIATLWEGGRVDRTARLVPVEEVAFVGAREVASIQTSVGTFVTGGFLTHNSHWDVGWLKWSILFAAAQGKDDNPVEGARITEADWEFGRWHHGLSEFAAFGARHPEHRPPWYPQETPAGGWAAARWYQSHVVNRRRLTDMVRTRSLASAAKRAEPAPLCNVPEPR